MPNGSSLRSAQTVRGNAALRFSAASRTNNNVLPFQRSFCPASPTFAHSLVYHSLSSICSKSRSFNPVFFFHADSEKDLEPSS
jgi:hypothetical protein